MACAQCGSTVPSGAKFCHECGAAQQASCPACGSAVLAGAKFCNECGQSIDRPSIAASSLTGRSAPGPVAERRVCSVLFCDLVGFTPISEARDPEEVRELLSRYFAVAQEVIGRYGGVVEKFIGDATMAVWGTPTATEGDVERAVRAALDLVDRIPELGRTHAGIDTLQARAGVVTGEVAVTIGATGQGMVAGDAVNTAARVQTAAEPGTVLVDESTWRLARGGIEFLLPATYELKGKTNPTKLWRAQRVVSGLGGSQRVDGLEAPLIGRTTELRLIKEMFHSCADRRSPRLVSVTGPAGVGKSRLGWEFEKYADGLVTSLWWHRGRCLSYGDGVAFWALAEMVRQRFGIAEDDPTAIAAEKMRASLPLHIPDVAERDYVAPRLASLLGIETATVAALPREELFAGWRLFFERLAATEPVVMLFEDLQYADSGLLDFLDHLLDWARGVSIFVLTLARPEIEDRRPGWGAGRRNSTSLTLEPLDAVAMSAMLEGLVPGMPPEARESVALQAQGMPLYAVETIRMLVDREVVRPIDGVYRLVGDLGELSVPETLQLLLAARLDALPVDARRLVADAAVLGGSFSSEALAAVNDEPIDRIREDLADLVRREVLEVKADPLSPNRGQYGFVQTMFRQVAYDTLSRRERKARHLAVADHLSRAFADSGEDQSEVIASHLLDALDAVPDDPDVAEIRERTISTLTRAGDRAERTGAPATAVRVFSTAARLCEDGGMDGELTARLLDSAAANATRSGDLTASVELHLHAAETYRREGNIRKAARSESRAGRSLTRTDVAKARDLMQTACATLEDPPDEDTALSVGDLAFLALSNGWAEGDDLILRALELAQGLGLSASHIADLLIIRGIGHSVRGRQAQALANYREARRMAEVTGDSASVARASMNLSDAIKFFDPAEAAAHGFEAIALCRRIGNGFYLATGMGNLLMALLMTDWSPADPLLKELIEDDLLTSDSASGVPALISIVLRGQPVPAALEALTKNMMSSNDLQDRATSHLASAILAKARGDTATVGAEAHRALETGEALPPGHEVIVWAWTLAADAAIDLADIDEASRLLDWLMAQPVGHVPPFLRAERKRVDGRVRAARGDGTAGDVLDEAIAAMRQFGSPYHLALALLDRADALKSADSEQAQRFADEANELATSIGAGSLGSRLMPYGLALAGSS